MSANSVNPFQGKVERATVSIPEEVMEKGKRKARSERRSFSSYITRLVELDLEKSSGEFSGGHTE